MKLHQLRDFIAVARAGSIHRAARELNIAQSSVTKSIRALEKGLGTPLFVRTAHGTTLNSIGERFLARVEVAMNELRRGQEEVGQLVGKVGGRVAIALSGTPAMLFLPPALTAFRKRYPQIEVRIVEGLLPVMLPGLRDGSLDFALTPLPLKSPGSEFSVVPVLSGSRTVVGRRGHPLAEATSLAQLLDAEWVLTGATGSRTEEFEQPFKEHGLPVPRAFVTCESLIALVSLLSSSDLLAILPNQWVRLPLTSKSLIEIPIKEEIRAPTISLVRRAGVPLTPAAEAFADALLREAEYVGGDSA